MCFSHKLKDCLLGEGKYMCNSYFNNTTDEDKAVEIIESLILQPTYNTTEQPTKEYTV
jgi:hypothetical protein